MSTSKLGVSTHVSKKFLDETVRLRSRINFLKTQNEGYDESQKLANETKDAKTRMEDARKSQLDTVQTIINQEMVRMDDFIYDGKQYAPEIKFSDAKNGNPKYTFGCDWNSGTGENYKNLGWNVYSWTDDDDNLVYAQLYDAYGNDVLLFRVDKKGQLEAYGGIDGSSDSWDVVSKKYTTD